MWPKVARIATILNPIISFGDGWTQTLIAGGAKVSVTNTLSIQTMTNELCSFVNSFDSK